jgi:hypothetical protein
LNKAAKKLVNSDQVQRPAGRAIRPLSMPSHTQPRPPYTGPAQPTAPTAIAPRHAPSSTGQAPNSSPGDAQ